MALVSDGMVWPTGRSIDGGIDEVPFPGSGRLSLCGKHVVGPDPRGALSRADATVVVCLTERHELADRYPEYIEWLEKNPASSRWYATPDLHALGLSDTLRTIAELNRLLDEGHHLLIHCGAGIGRAGTLATCLLMSRGSSASEALSIVALHRPMAGPEAGAQRQLIEAVAASFSQSQSRI